MSSNDEPVPFIFALELRVDGGVSKGFIRSHLQSLGKAIRSADVVPTS